MSAPDWRGRIRRYADFPRPGVGFLDLMPVLADGESFGQLLEALAEPWRGSMKPDVVAGVESRGFLIGAPLARVLGCGFIPLRKPGKLPGTVHRRSYSLEYGEDALEMQADALAPGRRVLLVDDVLATGGTLAAALALLGELGAEVVGAGLVLEIVPLGGRARLPSDCRVEVLERVG
ncbi:adenine phosphoribosyltransferase [Pseudomarimonas salicorniae]|uniref:adenine phosphoribosyltransferase n=1 Tax=Pseudomarimonas salicorniae TaxID=2933270 RepID=UPI003CCCECD3